MAPVKILVGCLINHLQRDRGSDIDLSSWKQISLSESMKLMKYISENLWLCTNTMYHSGPNKDPSGMPAVNVIFLLHLFVSSLSSLCAFFLAPSLLSCFVSCTFSFLYFLSCSFLHCRLCMLSSLLLPCFLVSFHLNYFLSSTFCRVPFFTSTPLRRGRREETG